MQSALEQVKGVKEVSVYLEAKEAVVKYDPDVVKVDDLIKAVKERAWDELLRREDQKAVMLILWPMELRARLRLSRA